MTTARPLCQAQEPGNLFDVKMPQAEVSPALVPKITNNPVPRPTDVKPVKKVSELPWYWCILGWFAINIARDNTEKQSDGRPHPPGNSR